MPSATPSIARHESTRPLRRPRRRRRRRTGDGGVRVGRRHGDPGSGAGRRQRRFFEGRRHCHGARRRGDGDSHGHGVRPDRRMVVGRPRDRFLPRAVGFGRVPRSAPLDGVRGPGRRRGPRNHVRANVGVYGGAGGHLRRAPRRRRFGRLRDARRRRLHRLRARGQFVFDVRRARVGEHAPRGLRRAASPGDGRRLHRRAGQDRGSLRRGRRRRQQRVVRRSRARVSLHEHAVSRGIGRDLRDRDVHHGRPRLRQPRPDSRATRRR